jgi:hypothetical protein
MSSGLVESSGSFRLERRSPGRVALVAVGVAALGAVGGAIAGVLSATLWLLVFQTRWLSVLPQVFGGVALLGAALGAVLMPLAGFTALRRIPLGKILATAIVGSAVGGIVGAQFFNSVVVGPIVGFVAAVAWLAVRAHRSPHGVR